MVLSILSTLFIGFSVIAGAVLYVAYVRSSAYPKKTPFSLGSGAVFIVCISILQFYHLAYFQFNVEPLEHALYLACLFAGPALFFYFFRAVALPDAPFHPRLALLLVVVALPMLLPLTIALPVLLATGTGYSLWLGRAVYRLRDRRKQHRFEMFFAAATALLAAGVFVIGAFIPVLGSHYFYTFYALSIGLSYALVLYALTAIPEFINELFEVARSKYAVSTLGDVDVPASLRRLETLMTEDRLYVQDDLNLSRLADAVGITGHQLSELINTRLGCSVSRYIKQQRIAAARDLLKQSPEQSILSISLETGFKSQSTFYAAFKEDTGQSPGDFRRSAGAE